MIIYSIDPGDVESGFCFYRHGEDKHHADRIIAKGKLENKKILQYITNNASKGIKVYIEDIAQYGSIVGKHIFDTIKFIGMIMERCNREGVPFQLVFRKTVVTHHTDNPKANDTIMKYWFEDNYGKIGTEKRPGPMITCKGSDIISAICIAAYGSDMEKKRDQESKAS